MGNCSGFAMVITPLICGQLCSCELNNMMNNIIYKIIWSVE